MKAFAFLSKVFEHPVSPAPVLATGELIRQTATHAVLRSPDGHEFHAYLWHTVLESVLSVEVDGKNELRIELGRLYFVADEWMAPAPGSREEFNRLYRS